MNGSNAVLFTAVWLIFCVLWGGKAIVIRRGRRYAEGREFADKNTRFKYMSYFAFVVQVVLVPMIFWSDSPLLLEFHHTDILVFTGLFICFAGLHLYLYAIKHLGRNYSPCFDSHLPVYLVSTGPYKYIRHPGWLSKLLVGVGGLLVSGSLWFIPIFIWLIAEMKRTITVEEKVLKETFPQYTEYKSRTKFLLPFVY